MASAHTKQFTTESFEREVLASGTPVLVDFWAPWCGPCRAIAPTIDALADEAQGRFVVGKVNVDDAPALASQYGVQSIPTILVIVNGQVAERLVGLRPKDQLLAALERAGAGATTGSGR